MGVLVKNGTVVTPATRRVADVYCEGGRIAAVGPGLEKRGAGDRLVDASGQLVLPGAVDPHVHLALPVMGTWSADDHASGTACAVAGGTTTVIDFVTPDRGVSLLEELAEWELRARTAVTDYAFHVCVTGWSERTAEEMRVVACERGIPSFKVLLAYKHGVMIDDHELYQVMKQAARLGAVVLVHGENGDAVYDLQRDLIAAGRVEPRYHPASRPSFVEGEGTNRALVMARLHGTPTYVVHMTCRESLEALARARAHGLECYGETCPQYLLLDDSVYERPGFEAAPFVMSPPLRPRAAGHQDALWDGLRGGLLDTVGTDHCPFTLEQKRAGLGDFTRIPNGGNGLEERLGLLYSYGVVAGRLTLERMVEVACAAPARIFGLYPRKGAIAPGSDADVVVWDPAGERVISAASHHSRADLNVYEGFRVKGKPSVVIVNGRVQYEDGDLKVERGAGRFLRREPRAPAAPAA
jgi:dihydropyrimidinase